jgi:hypothetical protein
VRRWLVLAAVAGPIVLMSAWAMRVTGHGPAWLADLVYLAASRVCHQRPDRSFVTAGVQWPVCGRCAGLYLAAPFGAAAALVLRRRPPDFRLRALLLWAAVPTALTLGLEWSGAAPISTFARALAALPLGAVIAFVLVRAAPGAPTGAPASIG